MSDRPPKRAGRSKAGPAKAERAVPVQSQTDAPPVVQRGNTYLYGILRWPVPQGGAGLTGSGIGDPPRPVRLVRAGPVAAVVSDVWAEEISEPSVTSLRRDMKAHTAVLNRVAADLTVLPARF